MEIPAAAFGHSISQYAFASSSMHTLLRRSSRRDVANSDELICQSLEPASKSSSNALRKGQKGKALQLDEGSPKKKRRLLKRGYAEPETYAHLNALSDHLAPSLEVLFCGINPGCMSATKGHHFANPTNHFWKCLHLSGFTPRLLSPSEDATIPTYFSLGLTNLVERPSAEEAELSKEEMIQSVPALTTKIASTRPLVVCFVGKGIWLIVEAVFKKQMHNAGQDPIKNKRMKDDMDQGNARESPLKAPSSRNVSSPSKTTTSQRTVPKKFNWGLQPYKLDYSNSHVTLPKEEFNQTPKCLANETLFFVMPSTSARVVSHQLADKVKLFSRLRYDVEKIKSKTLDTSEMMVVPQIP